jgi:hypothetical protein
MLFSYTSFKDIFVIERGRELLADKNVTYYCHLDTSLIIIIDDDQITFLQTNFVSDFHPHNTGYKATKTS